ncbi:hypothetical protein [Hyalangium sp.]|uniref:hypothetical protein n=1 Tax=Hyalangium sp. TaxID=2028555 RepID=UPI002D4FE23C|nr:hypothetical protein [Hyalangium sp.]HYH95681.1 hypothetical protein [Hyalangium sp.]
MALALIVFVRMWIVTHKPKEPEAGTTPPPSSGMQVDVASPSEAARAPSPAASQDCKTLERALDVVIRTPGDSAALAEAQRTVEACGEPPVRACELGMALDARAPLTQEASPARELLKALCQRCPAAVNTCAELVSRTLVGGLPGRRLELAEVRWNLENAGPGTAAACAVLVREALVPAAVTGGKVDPEHPALVTELAPLCAKGGHLPPLIVNAVLLQQGMKAGNLAALAKGPVATTSPDGGMPPPDAGVTPDRVGPPMAPAQVTGAEAGRHAFDGNEKTGVDLGNGVTERWEADGALRAQFEPPLKQLTVVRIKAKGPGSLRAIVRTPKDLGLKDPERGTFFVNPTVCQFKGTGQWEACTVLAPLLDVEALSVFPSEPKISLYELEARGP